MGRLLKLRLRRDFCAALPQCELLESGLVRIRSLLIFVIGSALCATAETIHLKNGRAILADSVRETATHVEYTIGEDTYALPKASVDHVDSGGSPVHSSGSSTLAARSEMPITAPTEDISRASEVQDKLIRDGHVDESAIADVEKIGSAELSGAAYYVAGQFEFFNGDRERARRYLERGLSFLPNNAPMLDLYVASLLRLHREHDAVAYAEQATRVAPRSADSFFLLGQAYFLSDRTQDAIRAFKQSVQLRPDATVQEWLERAERESSAENNFTEADTGHFALHYEGGKSSDALRGEILNALETHYNELVGEIGIAPRSTISVSLYTSQAFFDVTQAPGWSGAVYDGKLRIPVEGLTSVTPELSRVLKHELAHAFISQITRGRCPQWLNEGVAMSVEPRELGSVGYRLQQVYAAQRQMPLSALEGNWLSFSTSEASLAYYEGLAGVLYIRDTYGMSDVQRILQRIGDGSSTEAAMRTTIHGGYADLEEGVAGYLKKNFGP